MLTLLIMAAALRCAGAVARSWDRIELLVPGWLACMTATWMVAGMMGFAFPLWPALLIGFAGAMVEWRSEDPSWIAAGDLILLLAMAVWALPSPGWLEMLLLIGGLSVAWTVLEGWARLTPVPLRVASAAAALLIVGVLAARLGTASDPLRPVARMLPQISVVPSCEGERVQLETGSVAWYDPPRGDGLRPGALLFHGADSRGGRQPAACSLRRALLDAGFGVLSVDHPGYGASPAPPVEAEIEAWDPLAHQLAGLDWLERRSEVTSVQVLAGHSMGTIDALRLLGAMPDPAVTFLFGLGLGDGAERDDYWLERFHTDRRLSDRLSEAQWRAIQERYYNFYSAIEGLPSDHPRIVFVEFGWEWENLRNSRDPAFQAIPGAKERWTLPHSSHYFSAFNWYGLLAADAGVIRSVSKGLRERSGDL